MKQAIKNIGYARLTIVAVAVIAVVSLAFWIGFTAIHSSVDIGSDKKIGMTPEHILSTKAIGQWELLSISYEEMVDTTRTGILLDDHLVRIYYGTLRIGIDLSAAKPGWITSHGDSVSVILPPIGLLDNDFIDETRTVSFHESGQWTAADREALYRKAHRMMLSHGLTQANIRSAENNADAQFRKMLRAMGYENITIRFDRQ